MDIAAAFQQEIQQISDLLKTFPFEDRAVCGRWLNQQFYLVQNSSRYLALSAARVKVGDRGEFNWWAHHLKEETDHDRTLLRDMQALGHDPVDPMLPETQALIAFQYHGITEHGGDALLGYALLLEGLSCRDCLPVAERIERALGIKSSYLHLHGTVDLEHYPQGIQRLTNFAPPRKSVILNSLRVSAALYVHLLNTLNVRSTTVRRAA
jgi:hypothetical protein